VARNDGWILFNMTFSSFIARRRRGEPQSEKRTRRPSRRTTNEPRGWRRTEPPPPPPPRCEASPPAAPPPDDVNTERPLGEPFTPLLSRIHSLARVSFSAPTAHAFDLGIGALISRRRANEARHDKRLALSCNGQARRPEAPTVCVCSERVGELSCSPTAPPPGAL
jgi:hypothetical protein